MVHGGGHSQSATPGGAAVLEKAPERVRKQSPRYKVLLHNDPVNTMEYVVGTPCEGGASAVRAGRDGRDAGSPQHRRRPRDRL